MNKQDDAAMFLICSGANINIKSFNGKTPFNLATEIGSDLLIAELKKRDADDTPYTFPNISGNYLGMKEPGVTPEIFAPGIISALTYDHSVPAFLQDYTEVYWSEAYDRIMFMKQIDEKWTAPEQAPFSIYGMDANIVSSPDGNRLYFLSKRPVDGTDESKYNMWYVEEVDGRWSAPKTLGKEINSYKMNHHFSIAENGTLYFGGDDIYFSKFSDGQFQRAVKLGEEINTEHYEFSPFISSDESFIIFSRYFDGGSIPYISFCDEKNEWGESVRLNKFIPFVSEFYSCNLSPDGKYFFYANGQSSDMDIYWVDAKFITELKPKNTNK